MSQGAPTAGVKGKPLQLLAGLASLGAVAAVLLLPAVTPWLLRTEHWTADWRNALLSDTKPRSHEDIALVVINDITLKDVNKSPIDRKLLAKIVRAIDAASPRVIGLDLLFFQKTDPAADEELTDAIKNAKAKVVVGAADERADLQPFQREFQSAFLAATGRPVGYLNLHHDPGGVVRFASPPAPGGAFPKSFARLIAEEGGAAGVSDSGRPIAWLDDADDRSPAFLSLPAQDLVADPDLGVRLKGHLVLVGGDFPLRDRHRVPLTVMTGNEVSGLSIHAQILAGMLEPRRAFSELSLANARLLLVSLAAVGFAIGWQLGRSRFARYATWGVASGVLLAIDAICYRQLRIVMPFSLAAVAWFAGLMAGRFLRNGLPSFVAPERRTA